MPNVRIRIKTEAGEVEFEGDTSFVLEMLEQYKRGKLVPGTTSKPDLTTLGKIKHDEDPARTPAPGEFIRKLQIKKHTEYVLAFAFYLYKYSGLDEFSAVDINNMYYDCRMEKSNTSQMITYNIRGGLLMDGSQKSKGKRNYRITAIGMKLVESWLKHESGE